MQNSNINPFGDVMKWVGIAALSVVGVGVFLFSASNNFILFLGIWGNDFGGYVMAALGLTILDIAAVGWIVYGVSAARGVFQRVVSWLTGAVCLALALTAAVSELVIKQEYTARPEWIGTLAIASIIIGLVVNAIAITVTHIIDPATFLSIKVGMKKDKLQADIANQHLETLTLATQKTRAQMQNSADALASVMSKEMYNDALKELLGYTPGGDGSNQWKVLNQPASPAMAAGGGSTDSEVRTTYRPMNVGSPVSRMGGQVHQAPTTGMNHKPSAPRAQEQPVEVFELDEEEDFTLPSHPTSPEGQPPKATAPRFETGPNGTRRILPRRRPTED